jgi:hypothetical protein
MAAVLLKAVQAAVAVLLAAVLLTVTSEPPHPDKLPTSE